MIEKFIIGLIGSPFGVNGFVKVRPCSGEINHLLKLQSVIVCKDGKEKLFNIEECNPSPTGVLMRFSGIDSPETAKTLNGAQLIAGRHEAAPLKKNEFYVEDLKGLPVVSVTGDVIGNIFDIIEGGGGELAEIMLLSGEKRLVPFRKEFFPEISPLPYGAENGRVVLDNLWILE